jgi:phage-related minor tail protein
MDYAKIMGDMKTFVSNNLKECCQEMISWSDNAVLVDGKVRQAAKMIQPVAKEYSLSVVESEVKMQAMMKVADES